MKIGVDNVEGSTNPSLDKLSKATEDALRVTRYINSLDGEERATAVARLSMENQYRKAVMDFQKEQLIKHQK